MTESLPAKPADRPRPTGARIRQQHVQQMSYAPGEFLEAQLIVMVRIEAVKKGFEIESWVMRPLIIGKQLPIPVLSVCPRMLRSRATCTPVAGRPPFVVLPPARTGRAPKAFLSPGVLLHWSKSCPMMRRTKSGPGPRLFF